MSGSRSIGPPNSCRRPRIVFAAVLLPAIATLIAAILWLLSPSAEALLPVAEQQLRRRDYAAALETAQQILRQPAASPEAQWIAGRAELGLRNPHAAAKHFLAIPTRSPRGLEAALEAADILQHRLAVLTEAEVAWRKALDAAPDHTTALTGLARLLALAGRRSEAAPLILRLVQLRQPSELLIVLARPSGTLQDEAQLQQAATANPADPLLLLAQARAVNQSGDIDRAAELCRSALAAAPEFLLAPIHAELGRCLLQLDDTEQLRAWHQSLPRALTASPEFSRITGLLRLRENRPAEALPLLLEAARHQPEYRDALWQLSRLLEHAALHEAARRCNDFLEADRRLQEAQDRVLFSEESLPDDALELVNASLHCGRLIEAAGWAQLATKRFPENGELQTLADQLMQSAAKAPLQLVQASQNPVQALTPADVTLAVDRL
ncbi:MAG: tetratricopeptide repeat protein, partial [Planctomycetota bacterium]